MADHILPLATSIVASQHARTAIPAELLKWVEILVPAIATLIAAFAGVWYANKRRDIAEEKKRRATEVAAGNRALFVIFTQINELLKIQEKIDQKKEHKYKHFVIAPTFILNPESYRFDFDSLSFLAKTNYLKCLRKLYLAERKFQSAAQLINEHVEYLHVKQSLFREAGIKDDDKFNDMNEYFFNQKDNTVGPTLRRYTEMEICFVNETLPFLEETEDKLRSALKVLFPEDKIIDFKPIDNGGQNGVDGRNQEAPLDTEVQA
ncbi:MAG: hypothetical protein ABSG42_00965 [Nitrospirota bacterium]